MKDSAHSPTASLPASTTLVAEECPFPAQTNLPEDLFTKLANDAKANERGIAAQLRFIVRQYYAARSAAAA